MDTESLSAHEVSVMSLAIPLLHNLLSWLANSQKMDVIRSEPKAYSDLKIL